MNPHLTGDACRDSHGAPVQAACHDADPALFFPSGHGFDVEEMVESAKNLCRRCPVRLACLAQAIRHSETEGIWGGFTMPELRRLRARANRLRTVDPGIITELRAGLTVQVPVKERPGVVFRLLSLGWSEARIADALDVAPFVVQTARRIAEDAADYEAAERQARGTLPLSA
ncbi:WhiB family transcriptional regulator [Streptomyces sp. NPDC000410]|uniref:WhiB family transcriptional regulator n=1 Tax=Streptomyces sp. NPDC000410 TaxID=3154254 RepID=UPI0033169398